MSTTWGPGRTKNHLLTGLAVMVAQCLFSPGARADGWFNAPGSGLGNGQGTPGVDYSVWDPSVYGDGSPGSAQDMYDQFEWAMDPTNLMTVSNSMGYLMDAHGNITSVSIDPNQIPNLSPEQLQAMQKLVNAPQMGGGAAPATAAVAPAPVVALTTQGTASTPAVDVPEEAATAAEPPVVASYEGETCNRSGQSRMPCK